MLDWKRLRAAAEIVERYSAAETPEGATQAILDVYRALTPAMTAAPAAPAKVPKP